MASHPSDDQDATSDYGDSITTSEFTSLNTTRLLHSYEHGRRVLVPRLCHDGVLQGRYGMPNDDAEQLREGVKHRLYSDYILEGKLFIAPVGPRPQKIVDLGTGFGLWALDVAEQYPSARVIGVDLSPIQPNWLPPNLEFRVEDLDDEYRPWTNIYLGADLMHLRFLLPTVRRPELLLRNCLENLKPGGWIEIHDIIPKIFSDDGTAGDNHPIHILYKHIDGPFSSVYGWNLQFPLPRPAYWRASASSTSRSGATPSPSAGGTTTPASERWASLARAFFRTGWSPCCTGTRRWGWTPTGRISWDRTSSMRLTTRGSTHSMIGLTFGPRSHYRELRTDDAHVRHQERCSGGQGGGPAGEDATDFADVKVQKTRPNHSPHAPPSSAISGTQRATTLLGSYTGSAGEGLYSPNERVGRSAKDTSLQHPVHDMASIGMPMGKHRNLTHEALVFKRVV
ncbi:hypothetical protein ACCO45_011016 [Purpureocillium lilacinum]|uniref:Uncharacterized protein n=1 Tax=Purpureocillium lilacinum TaxID=33203 RepID=A0ACC4DH78_PURLI